jgi:hypothetical protein
VPADFKVDSRDTWCIPVDGGTSRTKIYWTISGGPRSIPAFKPTFTKYYDFTDVTSVAG